MSRIKELLSALANKEVTKKTMENTKNNWQRIGDGDSFSELGLNASELTELIREWVQDNPYNKAL